MKFTKIFTAVALLAVVSFSGCKPKDADIEKAISAKMAGMTEMKDMKVAVKDGVATLTGECADEACKANCVKAVEGMGIKGVKSVVSNCSLKPAPASTAVNVSVDAAVQKKITDGLKDIKGATVVFEGKKAIFSGVFTASQKTTLQQLCSSAGVAADMSKATVK